MDFTRKINNKPNREDFEEEKHNIVESHNSNKIDSMLLDYESCLTTGPFSIFMKGIPNVRVTHPNSVHMEKLRKLIEELKKVQIDDTIFIVSSQNIPGLFSIEDSEISAINVRNSRKCKSAEKHFNDLLNKSLYVGPAGFSCSLCKDHNFLVKLVKKFKKELLNIQKKNSLIEENVDIPRGINTRLDSKKIKTIIYLRNQENKTFQEIALIVGTSRFTVSKIVKQSRNLPVTEWLPKKYNPPNKIITPKLEETIRIYAQMRRGLVSANTIRKFLNEKFHISVSCETIYRILKDKLKFSRRIGVLMYLG